MTTATKCSCCAREYTFEEWCGLHHVGHHVDDVARLDIRNCSCGSTIAIPVGPLFLYGTAGDMTATPKPPRRNDFNERPYALFPNAAAVYRAFPIRRGRLAEFKTTLEPANENVYARVVHDPEAIARIMDITVQIEDAQDAIRSLQKERQKLLADIAVGAGAITEADIDTSTRVEEDDDA